MVTKIGDTSKIFEKSFKKETLADTGDFNNCHCVR